MTAPDEPCVCDSEFPHDNQGGCGVPGCQTCNDEFVRCPDCGCIEPLTAAFCWRCGAGLDDDEAPESDA